MHHPDRTLEFLHNPPRPLIAAAKAKTAVTLPGESVELTLTPAASFETTPKGTDTLLTLYGAAASRVTVTWKPKVEPKKVEAVVFADQNTQVTVGRGVLRAETAIDYSILQGKVKQFVIGLPADATLLSVKGEGLRTWDVSEQDNKDPLKGDSIVLQKNKK